MLIHCFITATPSIRPKLCECLRRFQHVICKRSILLTQSFCSRSFSVRWSAVIFSFERQSHWDPVCCFTRQWKPFKRNGLLLVCLSNSALSWEVLLSCHSPSTLLQCIRSPPWKRWVYSHTYVMSFILFRHIICYIGSVCFKADILSTCLQWAGASSWRSQPSVSSLLSRRE